VDSSAEIGSNLCMDLDLTDDQELLRETAARFIEDTCPLTTVRALSESETGLGDGYLTEAANLGWFALLVDEEFGGGSISDNAVADLAVIAEERGRFLQPGPFIPMNIVALALSRGGSDQARSEVLPGVMAGEVIATWAAADASGSYDAGAGVVATTSGGATTLAGVKSAVQDAHVADWILVTAGGPDGVSHHLVPAGAAGVTIEPLDGIDLSRRFSRVTFDEVTVDAGGAVAGGLELYERLIEVAGVLTVCETVGGLGQLFDITLEYAKDRRAFGRPIGSFQALKHQLADTGMLLEMSRGLVSAAVKSVGEGRDDAAEVVSMAKSFVSDNGVEISHTCFQLFGGIAYTWEHDQHLYYRRTVADASLYGEPGWHRERICAVHAL
jgi:alkylation response protein AidB-like acyl-CoA dehydrogenase